MAQTSMLARIVALVGDAAIAWRRLQGPMPEQAAGTTPAIPAGKPQGSIPTLKMPTARGWGQGQRPVAAPGLKVNAFASGLKHPRWICLLPNGDVTVAEALFMPGPRRSVFDHAMAATMVPRSVFLLHPHRRLSDTTFRFHSSQARSWLSRPLSFSTSPASR